MEVLVNRRSGVVHRPDALFLGYPRCNHWQRPDNYERKEVPEDSEQEWCGRCFKEGRG